MSRARALLVAVGGTCYALGHLVVGLLTGCRGAAPAEPSHADRVRARIAAMTPAERAEMWRRLMAFAAQPDEAEPGDDALPDGRRETYEEARAGLLADGVDVDAFEARVCATVARVLRERGQAPPAEMACGPGYPVAVCLVCGAASCNCDAGKAAAEPGDGYCRGGRS